MGFKFKRASKEDQKKAEAAVRAVELVTDPLSPEFGARIRERIVQFFGPCDFEFDRSIFKARRRELEPDGTRAEIVLEF